MVWGEAGIGKSTFEGVTYSGSLGMMNKPFILRIKLAKTLSSIRPNASKFTETGLLFGVGGIWEINPRREKALIYSVSAGLGIAEERVCLSNCNYPNVGGSEYSEGLVPLIPIEGNTFYKFNENMAIGLKGGVNLKQKGSFISISVAVQVGKWYWNME